MNTLELADALDSDADSLYAQAGNWDACALEWNAAKELRRLHDVNAELLEALKAMVKMVTRTPMAELQEVEQACEAITKAEGETA